MRAGLVTSSAAHALILAWGVWNFGVAKPFDVGPTEALPVEILTPQEFDAMTKGSKASKVVDAPKQKAEQVADAESEPVDDEVPVAKEDVKAPPPPPTKAEAPPKPEPDPAKIAAEKAAQAKAAAETAAKAEADKAAQAKAAQEKAVEEKAAQAKAAQEKAAAEKAEKLAEAADAELRAKAAAEKAAQEKAAQEKAAAEQAAAEKAAKEKADKLAKAKADAEKAAKAEAEKLAKAEKAAKEKAEAAKAAKAAERKFDPDKIASLLGNKASSSDSALKDVRDPSRKAASARATAPETTAGTSRGAASKLSMSERTGIDNAVREQVMQCWSPPIGASGSESLVVRVQFSLNADGSLADGPTVVNSSSHPAFRAAASAATRAVQRCAPLKLPASGYDYWKQVTINFDPRDMAGG